jgi:hypothetical protein
MCYQFFATTFNKPLLLNICMIGPGLAPADVTTHRYLETVAIHTAKELGSGAMKLPARGPKSTVDKVMFQKFSIADPDNFDSDPTSEK